MVTVIIPNFNHARFLDERIRSVLNQTYQDFEVMILDDCSTDNSLEVINRYKNHPKVTQIVVNEQNSGSPFKQWQKGISMAKGELIWIAESDDSCEPTFLETLVELFNKSHAVLAFCRSRSIDENGKEEPNRFQDSLTEDFVMDGMSFLKKHLAHKACVQNISSAIFSRDAATNVSREYMDYRGAGDWLFTVGLAEQGKVAYVNLPLNSYRIYEANTTARERKNGHGAIEVKRMYEGFRNKGLLTEKDFRAHRRDCLRQIHFSGYNNDVRNELLDMWGATLKERCWLQILSIYNASLLLKKKIYHSFSCVCR